MSPVTQADIGSSNLICEILKSTGIPVITEEIPVPEYEIRKNWEYYWLVDPLDGTKEFIKRNGEFAVNIALIERNEPVLGVIYLPVLKTIYFGVRNEGNWKKEEINGPFDALNFISVTPPFECNTSKNKHIVVTSRSHLNEKSRTFIHKLQQKYESLEIIESGSSYKLCLLAEGKADLYPRFGPTSEWDTAAGHVFTDNAGIEIKSLTGLNLKYNKPDLLNPDFIAFNPRKFYLEDVI
jgi:3'(2'), 5'-bisphosphate nucleotidase